jgi:hypothetical protein
VNAYIELSSSAQNAYADLFDSALALSLSSTIAGLNGSFGKKKVHGKNYWYFQYRDIDGKGKQVYVGPESEKLTDLIQTHRASSTEPVQRLAAAAIVLGCEPMIPKHFRVIRRLSEYGFFKRGGILVGTHAYMAMANMLGITPYEKMQTQDVDFAHAGRNVSIAMPSNIKVETGAAIKSLEMGLLPISTVEGKFGASYLNPADPAFRVDFLTSKSAHSDQPVYIEGLSIALQPLRFMEFSMVDTLQAAAFCNDGAVIVNIPKPDRFAVHKLIVSSERKSSETAKINKDIRQANVLIQYFMDHRPDELEKTCREAANHGPGWRRRLMEGIARISRINPATADLLANSIMDTGKMSKP